jgi:exosortase/archaeosortase family protein
LIVARTADQRWLPRLTIVLSAIPIAVLVNGLRVTATALATQELGQAAAEGLIHELLGVAMFGLALACLTGAARGVSSVRRPVALRMAS